VHAAWLDVSLPQAELRWLLLPPEPEPPLAPLLLLRLALLVQVLQSGAQELQQLAQAHGLPLALAQPQQGSAVPLRWLDLC
jgi:hypothetical protein